VIKGNGYGLAADWWAVGVILYEMLIGLPPFYNADVLSMYTMIQDGELMFPGFIHLYTRDIIARFLDRHEATRLGTSGIDEIKNHLFFEGVDWNDIEQKCVRPQFVPKQDGDEKQYVGIEFREEKAYDSSVESPETFYDFGYYFGMLFLYHVY
jgi:serine/threonine protein kinase